MKNIIFCVYVLLIITLHARGHEFSQSFDKENYYVSMSSGSIDKVNEQLAILKTYALPDKGAYEGALLMKKAGLVSSAIEKINLFKSGRKKLESEIQKNSENAEYRFLRVMIQENAPKIVNYRSDLIPDCTFIRNSFKKLSPALQKEILKYSKISKKLSVRDL
jgi:hypothetical protein